MHIIRQFFFQSVGAFWYYMKNGFTGNFNDYLAGPDDFNIPKYRKNNNAGLLIYIIVLIMLFVVMNY